MPVCPICKSEDFELFNGHYFCNECSTQSQEIREEEGDEESFFQTSKYLRQISGKRPTSERKLQDKSTLWFSCEAYNIILNRQVEALIKLGASPVLKNVVMELWFEYLKACEVAFVSDKEDWIPRLSSFPNCRDLNLLVGKSPTSCKSVRRQKRKKYQILNGKRLHVADKKKKKSKKKSKEKTKKSLEHNDEAVNLKKRKRKKKSSEAEQLNNEAEIPKAGRSKRKKKKKSSESEQPITSNAEEPNNVDLENANNEAGILKKRKKKKKSSESEQPNNTDLENPNNEAGILKERERNKKSADLEISNDESVIPKVVEEPVSESNAPKMKNPLHDRRNYSKVARKKLKMVGAKKLWAKGRAENCIDRMNLTKTICFCYAGLLLLQEQILLSDIMRWIHECHIPFLNAYRVLPESMVLRHTDITAMKASSLPHRRNIARESSRLLFFLGKRNIPKQSVCHIALRYIMDLNLPNEMAIVIHQLVNVKCPELSSTLDAPTVITEKKFIPYYELKAGALVIIVLKIIFGLDGKLERELSSIARELNSDVQADRQTFVWDDWQEQMSLKLNRQKMMNVTSTNYSAKEVLDVKSLHSFCKEIKYKPEDVKKVEISKEKLVAQRRAIHKAFSSLPNMDQKQFGHPPNSFPISTSTAEYVSQEYEVAHFLRDFSTYALPCTSSKKEPSHHYWEFPLKGKQASNVSSTTEFLDKLPQSFKVLVEAMCYTTNSSPSDLLPEVKKIEKLVFKRRRKKKKTPLKPAL